MVARTDPPATKLCLADTGVRFQKTIPSHLKLMQDFAAAILQQNGSTTIGALAIREDLKEACNESLHVGLCASRAC